MDDRPCPLCSGSGRRPKLGADIYINVVNDRVVIVRGPPYLHVRDHDENINPSGSPSKRSSEILSPNTGVEGDTTPSENNRTCPPTPDDLSEIENVDERSHCENIPRQCPSVSTTTASSLPVGISQPLSELSLVTTATASSFTSNQNETAPYVPIKTSELPPERNVPVGTSSHTQMLASEEFGSSSTTRTETVRQNAPETIADCATFQAAQLARIFRNGQLPSLGGPEWRMMTFSSMSDVSSLAGRPMFAWPSDPSNHRGMYCQMTFEPTSATCRNNSNSDNEELAPMIAQEMAEAKQTRLDVLSKTQSHEPS